ncbi:MAG: hypothetical protein HYZ90_03380 [Candidatus Omnitrophica bacterium]|nr:hypothetical protein [Candidatus Omnitrophota bacterium]
MKSWRGIGVVLLFLAGCAHAGETPVRLASACPANPPGPTVLCKHCNCYMPADADPAAPCTVCNCGYRNAQCVRGK